MRDCNLSTLLPVIAMVTGASQQEEDERNIALVENYFRKNYCGVASGSRSESNDSGYNSEDEQSKNALIEKEFELKLSIVMQCEILARHSESSLTRKEMLEIVDNNLPEESVPVRNIVIENMDKLTCRSINRFQFKALIADLIEHLDMKCKYSGDEHSFELDF